MISVIPKVNITFQKLTTLLGYSVPRTLLDLLLDKSCIFEHLQVSLDTGIGNFVSFPFEIDFETSFIEDDIALVQILKNNVISICHPLSAISPRHSLYAILWQITSPDLSQSEQLLGISLPNIWSSFITVAQYLARCSSHGVIGVGKSNRRPRTTADAVRTYNR